MDVRVEEVVEEGEGAAGYVDGVGFGRVEEVG